MSKQDQHSLPRLGKAVLHGCIELLFYLPIPLIAALYALDSRIIAFVWLFTLPVVYMVGYAAGMNIKSSRRVTRWFGAAALGVLHVYALLLIQGGSGYIALALALFGAIAAYRGLLTGFANGDYPFQSGVMVAGILIHMAAQVARLGLDELKNCESLLTVTGIASVIVYFFMMNGQLVNGESDTGSGRSGTAMRLFKRQNRYLTAFIVIIITAIGLFRVWEQMIEDAVKRLVHRIVQWLSRPGDSPPPTAEPANNMQPQLPEDKPSVPPHWLQVLEHVLKIAGTVLVILAICAALFYIGRYVSRWLNKSLSRLMEKQRAKEADDQGYEDEVESLMSLTKWSDQLKQKLRSMAPGRNEGRAWDSLSGAERVRLLYNLRLRGYMKKGYPFKSYLTPKETASDLEAWRSTMKAEERALFKLYEQVRYGEASPERSETEPLKPLLDKEK
ncbi:hypothetical protein [Paenibacillus protaetiae]|uniref:DUF4129 domain-containing protein n=1 Tax=Paenibacillus protaetiae TaxID=2509456 RepID=A0A4P6EST8_9BACL|nr:hypothetical protein [Paenibacillus protaetiae]QAY66002.1 hypothetical protein ET464_05965 [Paenibacillus protaetiae]